MIISFQDHTSIQPKETISNHDIILIQVPIDFDTSYLNGKNPLNDKSKNKNYTLRKSDFPLDQGGLLLPNHTSKSWKLCQPTQFYEIHPIQPTLSKEILLENGKKKRDTTLVKRSHPDRLKFKYKPFGSKTHGQALKDALHRYTDLQ